jgi:hypothetical protein
VGVEVVELGDDVVEALTHVLAPLTHLHHPLVEGADASFERLNLAAQPRVLSAQRAMLLDESLHRTLQPLEIGDLGGLVGVS